ncbi:MAG: hypothetical protein AABX35_01620 [Nanoarchaeota archaeon]
MESFSREEIDSWRDEFQRRNYGCRRICLDRTQEVIYFELPQELFQVGGIHIPNGLFRMTGRKEDGYVVGVSKEVPLSIQSKFAASEHAEFMLFGLEDQDRTLKSEERMIRIMEDEGVLRRLYRDSKLKLYNHMLEHARDNLEKWQFTPEDYKGFERARDFLQRVK